jgi:hypothetical protein
LNCPREGYLDFESTLKKQPEVILPALKEKMCILDNRYHFVVDQHNYAVVYKQGREERDSHGGRKWVDETVTTPIDLMLVIDGRTVFEFSMKKTVQYAREFPLFSERMGEVKAFIGGEWVAASTRLVEETDQYRRAAWERKNSPAREQKMLDDMKNLGIS